MTQSQPRYRRVLLKLSGEALQGDGTAPLDPVFLDYLAGEIREITQAGIQVGVVTGGGNIFRGLTGTGKGVDRLTGDSMGMMATVINSLALSSFLQSRGCATRVLSAVPIPKVAEVASGAAARHSMDCGEVVLFCGGTGNPYFTTDTAAVLRALESGCEVVLKATKVDGVYDRDPKRFADAVFLPSLTFAEALSRELQVLDRTAFAMCQENGLSILVCNIYEPGTMLRALRGEAVGSVVGA